MSPVVPAGSGQSLPSLISALLHGRRRRVAAGIMLGVLQALSVVPAAWLLKEILDNSLHPEGGAGLLVPGLALIALALMSAALGFGGRALTVGAIKAGITDLRTRLLKKIYALPRAYHDATETAPFHDLVVHDCERGESMLSALGAQVIPNALAALVLAGVLAWLSPGLLGAVLVFSTVFYFAASHAQRSLKTDATASRRAFAAFNRGIVNGLRRLDLVRLHSAAKPETAAHAARAESLRAAGLRTALRLIIHARLQQVATVAATVLLLVVGGRQVALGDLTLGELLARYALGGLLLGLLREIGSGLANLAAGGQALAHIDAFLSLAVPQPYTGTRPLSFSGAIVFEDVSFSHATPGREKSVFSGVSFALNPGSVTALTGPNGGGKSTLVHLLLGFYRPQSGRLLADSVPYDELDLDALRPQIGVVPQDPLIVTGTIRENIAYGLPEATPENVEAAARLAGADSFIQELPSGYETAVGDHGMLLSGGQRQRLALARAFLRRPKLYILDEPTNHLDLPSVTALAHTLQNLLPRPAILLVTHQEQVASIAQQVFRLDQGRLLRVA